MSSISTPPMTTEELLAMPEDGMERELIRGQLRERKMTRRNPWHSGTEPIIARLLLNWVDSRPPPRGRVFSGECGFRIKRNPDTTVGIDVAYVSAEMGASIGRNAALIDGSPILAVEILSPSDKQEDILDKVDEYLKSGVKLIWIVDPVFQTVTVYRPDAPPAMFNDTQELSGEPHLPGFRAAVASLFGK
ncbi:MAG TPA: Uma2 family endonuclease [Tepidisphaeraceae bacterium]|nr:Uma2 family endonuclease [Tepidisphaeraceae bacterium]